VRESDFLSVTEAVERLGVGLSAVHTAIHRGHLRALRFRGGHSGPPRDYIPVGDADAWKTRLAEARPLLRLVNVSRRVRDRHMPTSVEQEVRAKDHPYLFPMEAAVGHALSGANDLLRRSWTTPSC
jgi:excisionase family DNA binding protein